MSESVSKCPSITHKASGSVLNTFLLFPRLLVESLLSSQEQTFANSSFLSLELESLHKLYFLLTAHKNRKCIGTPSSCCGRGGLVSVSWFYMISDEFSSKLNSVSGSNATRTILKGPILAFPMEQTADPVVQVASEKMNRSQQVPATMPQKISPKVTISDT